MHGPEIVARTLSNLGPANKKGERWQYSPRSDRHSKIACWGILFDLIQNCRALEQQIQAHQVGFGINHEMRDFTTSRKKDLDLVICKPGSSSPAKRRPHTFAKLSQRYGIELDAQQQQALENLPDFQETPVGEVQLALEAKACMTEHGKALPRLYDELSSSHQAIHGSSNFAIAAGFVMVNISDSFVSPLRQKDSPDPAGPEVTQHKQPDATESVIGKVKELPRRSDSVSTGFDALGLVVVSCANDGSPIEVVTIPPSPQPGDLLHYEAMIRKISGLYESRFPHR